MPVRTGLPTGIKGITQLVHGPEYAAGVGLVTNNINGLVSWANTNYGARLFGGSLIKVRNSVLLTNGADGV